jgi:hypothetical protein
MARAKQPFTIGIIWSSAHRKLSCDPRILALQLHKHVLDFEIGAVKIWSRTLPLDGRIQDRALTRNIEDIDGRPLPIQSKRLESTPWHEMLIFLCRHRYLISDSAS